MVKKITKLRGFHTSHGDRNAAPHRDDGILDRFVDFDITDLHQGLFRQITVTCTTCAKNVMGLKGCCQFLEVMLYFCFLTAYFYKEVDFELLTSKARKEEMNKQKGALKIN